MRQQLSDKGSSVRTSRVVVHLPAVLRELAGGADAIEVSCGTVGQALAELRTRHSALVRAIRTEAGAIRPHVNVFVNQQDIRQRQGLDTDLKPGDTVIILPSISGG